MYRSFILNKKTFTKYCLTQCISKLPGSFEIHWVSQYLVNFMDIAGIVNATIYKTEPSFTDLGHMWHICNTDMVAGFHHVNAPLRFTGNAAPWFPTVSETKPLAQSMTAGFALLWLPDCKIITNYTDILGIKHNTSSWNTLRNSYIVE